MDIQGMCDEAVRAVVREVATKIVASVEAQQSNALVIYTGAKIGYAEATDKLGALRERLGLSYTVLMSEAAAEILDVEAIDEALKPADLIVGAPTQQAPEAYARDAGMLIVPALTANSCAHVAACMTDTYAQRAIVEGIALGRDVVASVNGCCPDNADRAKLGFAFPGPMAARLRANMETLRSYGVNLTTSEHIADKVERVRDRRVAALLGLDAAPQVSAAPSEDAGCTAEPTVAAPQGSAVAFAGHVVGAQAVSGLPEGATLCVAPDALVTSLARDVATRRSITISRTER